MPGIELQFKALLIQLAVCTSSSTAIPTPERFREIHSDLEKLSTARKPAKSHQAVSLSNMTTDLFGKDFMPEPTPALYQQLIHQTNDLIENSINPYLGKHSPEDIEMAIQFLKLQTERLIIIGDQVKHSTAPDSHTVPTSPTTSPVQHGIVQDQVYCNGIQAVSCD